MLTLFSWVIVFGIVVFVHELGHFVAAKMVGVYAPRFSIGFGPALFRRRRGETEYVLAALPLGGYVRMASREDEATAFLEGGSEVAAAEKARDRVPVVTANDAPAVTGGEPRPKDWDPEAMVPFGPKPVPEHRWFESKSLLARVWIMSAGVIMNFVLAFLMLVGVTLAYGSPRIPPVVGEVVPGSPAARAGIAIGDTIVSVAGTPVVDFVELQQVMRNQAEQAIAVEYARAGTRQRVTLTADTATATDMISGKPRRVGRIGIAPERKVVRERHGLVGAVGAAGRQTVGMTSNVLLTLKGLVTRDVSVKQLGGPIAIARESARAAEAGLEAFIMLIAFLSINVAILNLLPIPVLDGGQILMNVLEAIKGGSFSPRTREYVLRVGLAAILLLFVTVMWNDIMRLVTGGRQ